MADQRNELLEIGRAALAREGAAIGAVQAQLNESFTRSVEMILACAGHVIVSGAGTSSIVAQRLAHLLTCVGAPSLYLDAGESAHGGAAAVTARDVLLAISKGGETDELNNLVRVARERGAKVIALTARLHSTMGKNSDVVLQVVVPDDVEAHGVIALGSSLAAAAVGDALCSAVSSVRGYDADEFRKVHPGGAVGKALGKKP